jgi:choline dehydrogenase-like flavoprotein
MITDTRDLPDRATFEADVCVVGAGAAGIALALPFAGGPIRVVLLEGGGVTAEPDGRGIYQVVDGRAPRLCVDPSRTWYFGGNTNHWNANCRPLDDADFEARDWIAHSGWPIRRTDLSPCYERAQALCGLGDVRWYDLEACRPHLHHGPLAVDPATLTTKLLHACPVPAFGELHRRRIEDAANVRLLLHARAERLEAVRAGNRVVAVEATKADGRSLRVEAGAFVLAAGAVENAHLLLGSAPNGSRGLGNDADLVGRFFMEHWYVDIPLTHNGRDVGLYDEIQTVGDARVWGQLAISDDLQRAQRAPGLSLWFRRIGAGGPAIAPAARQPRLARMLADAKLAIGDPREAAAYALRRLGHRRNGASPQAYYMRVQLEQTPHPENRVRLSPQRDRREARALDLALRFGDDERHRHLESLRIATAAIGLDGRRLRRQLALRLDAGRAGFFTHHSGTTRMSADPAHGVVDADCRVHGVDNLFACGSSVFPTTGTAPPTLTIVALALRLADHLQRSRGV